MGNTNLNSVERSLRYLAKRYKSIKYSLGLAILFLMMGISAFSAEVVTREEIATSRENLRNSVGNLQTKINTLKNKNEKGIKGLRLELIQLMEQGNQVVKSPWASWQFGMNYMYNKWNGRYKGRGDKKDVYSYEGIFVRDKDIFNRYVAPNSVNYALLPKSNNSLSASTSLREDSKSYGLSRTVPVIEEPVITEVNAGIRPKKIDGLDLNIVSNPAISPNLLETIEFQPIAPKIEIPAEPNFPVPPSFNIKLGSFCNGMGGNGCKAYGTDGGQYGYGTSKAIGTPKTLLVGGVHIGYVNTVTLNTNDPSLTHGWANGSGSALFYAYFDAMDGNKGPNSSVILNGNLTVTSINPVQTDTTLSSYNRQKFLVGGSRIGTLDNVRDGTLKSNATINLVGPLTVGFEVQSDLRFGDNAKTRTLENAGIITDKAEENNTELDGILAKGAAPIELELAQDLGAPNKIKVSRTLEGYTGYKVGLIMTYEEKDINPNSKYVLKNSNIINFGGEKSIGIQIFAPKSPSRVEVSNASNSTITLGGIESYGMKWSSRVADKSTMDNSGILEISGDADTELLSDGTTKVLNSLSSGIAVIEGSSSESGNSAIRAYQGKVKNSGIINVSGGKGNTGIILLVNAPDDITNAANGTINVNSAAGRQNIAMRVEKGSVATDVLGTPKAINNGNIYLEGDSSIGMSGINADVENNKKIVTKANSTIINGIGMATRGGELKNAGEIDLQGTRASTNIGIYIAKGTNSPTGMLASTSKVKVKGNASTGILVLEGTLNYGGNITAEGNGISGLIIGDNASGITNSTITNNGIITVNNGISTAAGIYEYMNGTNKIKKGSYGIVVGKNSKFISDGIHNVDVNINVKGVESIGLYAGENAKLEVKNHTVNVDGGAVNYDADKNSTLILKGIGTAHTGKKSLLFYLGENGTGKILIENTMNAIVEGGTTPAERGNAFYYVGNGSAFGTTEIENWAKTNFGDGTTSTLNNLNLTMKPGSRLFVASKVGMNLSDTSVTNLMSGITGVPTITGSDYKTFMLYLSKLKINQAVDLNDKNDEYNRLEIANSSIENENTIIGSQNRQIAMAQGNGNDTNGDGYESKEVTLMNGATGVINLTGEETTGIYAKRGKITNEGKISVGKKSTGIYLVEDDRSPVGTVVGATATNETTGVITIEENSTGIFYKVKSEGTNSAVDGGIYNEGKIESTANNVIAMSFESPYDSKKFKNGSDGLIDLKGQNSTGMFATGTGTYEAINNGKIRLASSSDVNTPNIGMYTDKSSIRLTNSSAITGGNKTIGIYGYGVNLGAGSFTGVGNGGTGVYSKGGNIHLNGELSVGKNNAVGVYYVGATGGTITNNATDMSIGDGSYGFVVQDKDGTAAAVTLAMNTANVTLGNDAVYAYSNNKAGSITNSTVLNSTGSGNYGIYGAGTVTNNADIHFGTGIGNVGIYSILGGTATNNSVITIGASDAAAEKFAIGMAAGFIGDAETPAYTGNIVNGPSGIINVTGKNSIGMYATGSSSTATNKGTINLSGENTVGMYLDNGATGINEGTITTVGSPKGVKGIVLSNNSKLINRAGAKINIDSVDGFGVFRVKTGEMNVTIVNYGDITVSGGAEKDGAFDPKKSVPKEKMVGTVKTEIPKGTTDIKVSAEGRGIIPDTEIEKITNPVGDRREALISKLGMYVDTIGRTNPINGLDKIKVEKAELLFGAEVAQNSTSKLFEISGDILKPYRDAMRNATQVKKWLYSAANYTWATSQPIIDDDGLVTKIVLYKKPYTDFAKDEATRKIILDTDTHNFLDGLEQRYGVEGIGTRENQVFQKLNAIGNNEKVLFEQAVDEMMGHQYANVQQRVQATGDILDKEFDYLRDEWKNVSKDSNKVKTFGTKGEYKTKTAGVIDYKYNAYGVAYVHENEDIKLGKGIGWYTGIVHNTFKFEDIGRSKEEQLQAKVGLLKSVPFDDNNSLNWTISGDIFAGYNKMHRKFLVVDEVFNARSKYYTYGIGVKNQLTKNFRLSEDFSISPYVGLGLEYGRVSKIREKNGEIKLEVKQNDYISVKPEIGTELGFKHYFGRKTLKAGLSVAYENELGKVANGKNKARVADTSAGWYNLRGEKEDRRGNVKFDLNVGLDNQRVGVTANVGYDTKGENVRGGLGLRVIF